MSAVTEPPGFRKLDIPTRAKWRAVWQSNFARTRKDSEATQAANLAIFTPAKSAYLNSPKPRGFLHTPNHQTAFVKLDTWQVAGGGLQSDAGQNLPITGPNTGASHDAQNADVLVRQPPSMLDKPVVIPAGAGGSAAPIKVDQQPAHPMQPPLDKSSVVIMDGRGDQPGMTIYRFKKDVLSVGKIRHPVTGVTHEYTEDVARKAAESTNRFIKNGNQVSFPDGHKGSAMSNLGWWAAEFSYDEARKQTMGVLETFDPVVADKIQKGQIARVSPLVLSFWMDAKENEYEHLMLHICATNDPVQPNQDKFFAALSMSLSLPNISVLECVVISEIPVKSPANGHNKESRGKPMKEKLIAMLGIADGASESDILSALQSKITVPGDKAPADRELFAENRALQTKIAALSVEAETAKKASLSLAAQVKKVQFESDSRYVESVIELAITKGVPMSAEEASELRGFVDKGESERARWSADMHKKVIERVTKLAGEGSPSGSGRAGVALGVDAPALRTHSTVSSEDRQKAEDKVLDEMLQSRRHTSIKDASGKITGAKRE